MKPSQEFLKWWDEVRKPDSFQSRGKWGAWRACQPEIDRLLRENAALQSKIDALMLEYCPSEMGKEQIEECGSNQCVAEVDFMKGDGK